jgi:hypothetical protein
MVRTIARVDIEEKICELGFMFVYLLMLTIQKNMEALESVLVTTRRVLIQDKGSRVSSKC